MASRRKKAIAIAGIVGAVVLSMVGTIWYFSTPRYSDTLPPGQEPSLLLPIFNFSANDYIGGFGQITPEFWHGGFDFGVNDTTKIVSPCNAYVSYIQKNWYNDKGGHWQSNVNLRLNAEWEIWMPFESWTTDQEMGRIQAGAIFVEVGQYVGANETLGFLLCHGSSAHLHFGVVHNGAEVCPYQCLTDPAKIIFADRFAKVGTTAHWEN
ncbi:MAG: hypothetical protein JW839_15815 [Candidatus Lokiarchaeota archaeon]|nr:hypothetical protein [Candidatus Lokiarchaeota archaeon]